MKKKVITFTLDSLTWEGGVADNFDSTPLGILAQPLKIEQIAEVEWTIVYESFINIYPIAQETQLKFWLKLPEKVRRKIKSFSESLFPFDRESIFDRFLLAYSVQDLNNKYIGFTFESLLKESHAGLYVYMQTSIDSFEGEAMDFLENYLDDINKLNIEELQKANIGTLRKILSYFKPL